MPIIAPHIPLLRLTFADLGHTIYRSPRIYNVDYTILGDLRHKFRSLCEAGRAASSLTASAAVMMVSGGWLGDRVIGWLVGRMVSTILARC
jgi:hypothetical protein